MIEFFGENELIYENRMKFFNQNRTILEHFKFEDLSSKCDNNNITAPRIGAKKVQERFKSCALILQTRFYLDPDSKLLNWPTTTYVCDEELDMKDVPVFPIRAGKKEGVAYFAMVPNCKSDSNLFLTSIPDSKKAIEELSKKIPKSKISEIKLKENETDFGGNFENNTIIDFLLLNGDLDYKSIFKKDGIFDKSNITVCQMNLQIKMSNSKNFYEFIAMIFEENIKFLPMRPFFWDREEITVAYFFNVSNEFCVRKYL
ncbi:unnamed protein product [Caenorhabditis angaria]|uniref:Uncharacterized protein n=1 Tax=Caenorhabditis angaria TaxID=860376 RepID=A0A9P1IU71_9PELO|nr:unnamed protein product [Caenorhabditis angaria]